MNAFQKKLAELPQIRERLGSEKVDKFFVEFLLLSEELIEEMDGVNCPASASSIINRFSSIVSEIG